MASANQLAKTLASKTARLLIIETEGLLSEIATSRESEREPQPAS